MNRTHRPSQFGAAAVEFLLCVPLLLLLALPVVDLARVLQANIILTNISREGANLAARTLGSEQAVMEALAATALPLNMRDYGAVHITKILAHRAHGITRNVVIAQRRWVNGSYVPGNGVWTCGAGGSHWDGAGNCAGLPPITAAPEVNVMQGRLRDGDVVYLVEAFYRFPLLFSGLDLGGGLVLPGFKSDLYAFTIL
ncbi:MAG: hypothetical protein V7642_4650 [Burkholderiales bacterium]|jgi:hypothetical protein